MKKISSSIVQANLINITDSKTGVVTEMTRILYTVDRDDTDKTVGPATLESYKVGNHLSKIEKKTIKYKPRVELLIDELPTKNGVKFKLQAIDGVEL